jgi:hypothetical protein
VADRVDEAKSPANEGIGTRLEELIESLRRLEADFREVTDSAIGDDAQLANVDLQNLLQKQQQVLEMMSNISKMLYDTAMAVIRKLGS